MGSMVKLDENIGGMATPNFFNSAWNPDQGDFSFADTYQGDLGSFDGFPASQNYHMDAGDNEPMDYFSGQSAQQFQNQYPSGFMDISNDDVGRILTPGLSFLSVDMEPDKALARPTSYPAANQASSAQGMQPYATASLVFGPGGLEALPVDSWSSVEGNHLSRDNKFRDNDTVRKTARTHGQITPGDSPQEGDEPTGRKGSIAFLATDPISQEETRSTRIKRASTTKLEDPSGDGDEAPKPAKKPRRSKKKPVTKEQEEAKRKRFLERNRVAADKCRQNRKKWVDDLQEKCHRFGADNALKKAALEDMAQEVMQLKNMLLMHSQTCKDDKIRSWIDGEASRPILSYEAGKDVADAAEDFLGDGGSPDSQQSSSRGSTPLKVED